MPTKIKIIMMLNQKKSFTYKITYDIDILIYIQIYIYIYSCTSNYSIDIIEHCVNFFCNQLDICALYHLKYNHGMHQIYKLCVFLHPSVPVFCCLNLWICLQHL